MTAEYLKMHESHFLESGDFNFTEGSTCFGAYSSMNDDSARGSDNDEVKVEHTSTHVNHKHFLNTDINIISQLSVALIRTMMDYVDV